MKLTRYIGFLIVCFLFSGSIVGQTFDTDDCPRGPVIRVPITSLTKATSADFMVLTDSCGNQYYILKDSVTTKGGVINQYFAGDTLITITQGDTFITIIYLQGDTTGTGRFRLYDNISDEDTVYTFPAGVPTDNMNVTNGLNIDSGNPVLLKLGGRLIENTKIYGDNRLYDMEFDSLDMFRMYANTIRHYITGSSGAYIIQPSNANTMYITMTSPTSFYMRADTVMQLDLYNHGLSDTSHLLIRTDRARDGSWVKGGFLQLLRTSAGTHQGECDWSLYALPLAIPDSSGNYVLSFDAGDNTFDWAEESGGGGSGGISGSGTLNYVAKWTPNDTTLGNSQIFDNGTNVGIATASPAQKLHVQGTARITGSDGTATDIMGRDGDGDISNITVGSGLSFSGGSLSANPTLTGSGTVNYVAKWTPNDTTLGNSQIFDNGTNVGINNAAPGALLDLIGNGATSSTFTQIWNNSSSTTGWFRDDGLFYAGLGTFGGTSVAAGVELTVNGNARITGSDGTATAIMGRDGDGDISSITLGSGLSLTSGTLSASPTSLLYWTESWATYDTSAIWTPISGTNVNTVITPKGTGAFIVGKAPDGTSAGGNARGDNAIDIQTARTAASQVASGARAVAIGYRATASGTEGLALGAIVTASNGRNVAIGYNVAATSSGEAGVAIGHSSSVTGQGATAIGLFNDATAYGTLSTGTYSQATLYGQRAHQAYRIGTEGDIQTSDLRMYRAITGTAETEIFLDGGTFGSQRAILAGTNRVWNARIQVVAATRDAGNGSGATGDAFVGNYEVGIKRIGSTTTLIGGGVITNSIAADTDMEDAVVTITADDTNEALKITFTPPSSAGSTTQTYVNATIYLTELGF